MAIVRYKNREFEYKEEELTEEDLNPITHEDAKEILFLMQDVLSECNIKMHLSYGTLLGAVRDKDFIKGDLDVDVMIEDEESFFYNLSYIQEHGLNLIRAKVGCIYSFRMNERCYIDVYIKRPLRCSIWSLYCCNLEHYVVPKKYFAEESTLEFLGRTFICVKNPEKLLRFWYGDTWNRPIGKCEKEYIYEVKSHYYYAKYLLAIKVKMRKLLGDVIYDNLKGGLKNKG